MAAIPVLTAPALVAPAPWSLADLAEDALGEGSLVTAILELVALVFELTGVAILTIGSLLVAGRAVRSALRREAAYSDLRKGLGRVLLLGLEVLVAADIVRTVAVDTTMESVAILGLLVVVRTVLSFALAAEIDGVVPWRRTEVEAALSARETASVDTGRPGDGPPVAGRRSRGH
jgi:uncharacterized membrane protein